MDFSSINFKFSPSNCSNCGSDIHKRSTCPSLPCSSCGEIIGHTSTICPTRKLSDRIRHRRENLSEQQIEDQRDRHRAENMNEYQVENQRDRHRAENMTENQIENQRGRHRSENMSKIQIENQRDRHRAENMREIQMEKQRGRHRAENMSPQQRQSLQEREAVRRQFLSVAQEWDDKKPSPHCFHVYLKSVKKKLEIDAVTVVHI